MLTLIEIDAAFIQDGSMLRCDIGRLCDNRTKTILGRAMRRTTSRYPGSWSINWLDYKILVGTHCLWAYLIDTTQNTHKQFIVSFERIVMIYNSVGLIQDKNYFCVKEWQISNDPLSALTQQGGTNVEPGTTDPFSATSFL